MFFITIILYKKTCILELQPKFQERFCLCT